MSRPIRWFFRIVLGLFILGAVAVVAAFLLLDTIVREVLISRMRAATGMECQNRAVHVGLRSPTMTIEGLQTLQHPGIRRLAMPGHAGISPGIRSDGHSLGS